MTTRAPVVRQAERRVKHLDIRIRDERRDGKPDRRQPPAEGMTLRQLIEQVEFHGGVHKDDAPAFIAALRSLEGPSAEEVAMAQDIAKGDEDWKLDSAVGVLARAILRLSAQRAR